MKLHIVQELDFSVKKMKNILLILLTLIVVIPVWVLTLILGIYIFVMKILMKPFSNAVSKMCTPQWLKYIDNMFFSIHNNIY